MTEAQEIFSRINDEMKRQKKQQAELITYLNLPRGTYTQWKLGRTRYFCEHLNAIAKFLGIDPGWLLTGRVSGVDEITPDELELIRVFRGIEGEEKRIWMDNYRVLCNDLVHVSWS